MCICSEFTSFVTEVVLMFSYDCELAKMFASSSSPKDIPFLRFVYVITSLIFLSFCYVILPSRFNIKRDMVVSHA